MRPCHLTAEQLLLALIFTILCGLAVTAMAAGLAFYVTDPVHPDEHFAERFASPADDFFAGQPPKSAAFVAGCLAAPIALCLGCLVGLRLVPRVPARFNPWLLGIGAAANGLFFCWALSAMFYCPAPPYPPVLPSWFCSTFQQFATFSIPKLICELGAVLIFGLLWWMRPSRRYATFVFGVLIALWIAYLPSQFYAPSEVDDANRFTYHFNAVTEALSQVCDGRHFLVDFPSVYGGYVEFLGPVTALFPRTLGTLLVVFGLLKAAGVLFLLLTARALIRRPLPLLVTGLAILGEFVFSQYECYYQYSALRIIFPAATLFCAVRYFRRPSLLLYATVSTLAAVAPLWNLDTGLVLWLSWVGTLTARTFVHRGIRPMAGQLVLQVGALAAAVGLFLLYLRLVSGRWPDPALAFVFQSMTVAEGFFCIGLTVPDTWMVLLLIYLVGLATVVCSYLRETATWKTDLTLMLTLLGVGLFDYFMGRSAECNILWCIYPLILLLGILLDEMASLEAPARARRFAWALLLPFLAILSYCTALGVVGVISSVGRSWDVASQWISPVPTPLEANADFVKAHTASGDRIYILSRHSGIYYYLSATRCALEIPGCNELFDRRYINTLIAAIQKKEIPALFIDSKFSDGATLYRPDVLELVQQAIDQNYVAAQTSSTGRLTFYRPK